jgi:ribosome-binding ATPase YchF (GTP1/OBG family)
MSNFDEMLLSAVGKVETDADRVKKQKQNKAEKKSIVDEYDALEDSMNRLREALRERARLDLLSKWRKMLDEKFPNQEGKTN